MYAKFWKTGILSIIFMFLMTTAIFADEWTLLPSKTVEKENEWTYLNEEKAKTFEDSAREYYQWLREHPEYKIYTDDSALESSEIHAVIENITYIPSYNELYQIAHEKYSMDEASFQVVLGWSVNEGLYEDPYLAYLCACCPINYFLQNGTQTLIRTYTSWPGYSYELYRSQAAIADEQARLYTYLALEHLHPKAFGCHGVVVENGYTNTSQSIKDMWYATRIFCYDLPGGSRIGWYGVF